MNYEWTDSYLLNKAGVEKDFKPEWEAERYRIRDKMLAMRGTNKEGRPLLSLKLDPAFSEILRRQYPDEVIPGYYLNKTHWSSLYMDGAGALPEETLERMCDNAYQLIFSALPAKIRAEIQ